MVTSKASNAYLAQQGLSKALAGCVYTNPAQGNKIFPRLMADTVEAVVGAVFQDSRPDRLVVSIRLEFLVISHKNAQLLLLELRLGHEAVAFRSKMRFITTLLRK